MRLRLPLSAAGSSLVLALAVATAAAAQDAPPPSPRVACRSSAMSLCRDEIRAGDRAAIQACMIRNFDKATPECQAAMKYAQAHHTGAGDAAPPKP